MVRLQNFEPPQDTSKQDTTVSDTTVTDTTKKDTAATDTVGQDTTISIAKIVGPAGLSMQLNGHTLSVKGAVSARVDVFDMQGRPVFSAKNVKGSVDLKDVSEGLYVVRVRSGSASLTKRIAIK
jgi:endo-1,4-beta-xylanase